ncbi:hypothetical protein F4809DRAFT_598863 [Biscogniauxia mediterranea]|nr:hypothetical protein F4809DRAFT_598863 [Biscogniauxia mediterranea]
MSSYRDYVGEMRWRNPCLEALLSFLSSIHISPYKSTLSLIEIDTRWERSVCETTNIQDVALKVSSLQQQPRQDAGGMVIIVEDPGAAEIEILGSLLDIDPIFFCGHITSSYQDIEQSPSAPLLGLLPSKLMSKNHVNIHYQRVLNLGQESDFHHLPYKMAIPGNNPRTVRRLPPLSGKQVGLARTCCSALMKELKNGAWIYLILADSTTSDIVLELKKTEPGILPTIKTPQVPRRINPEDFRELPSYSDFQPRTKYPIVGRSLREDLLALFQEPLPGVGLEYPNILSLAYYPLQIALAEWMLYAQLMSRYVKLYEYSFEAAHTLRSESQDQVELHRWRRRSSQSLHKLRMARLFMEHWRGREAAPAKAWDFVISDLRHVEAQIEQHARSLETLNPILTSIVQLMDSHKSISEAADVKRLTYIAIVFIPLSFIAGLFSMGDDFLPGNNGFWVYWVTAIPITAVVVAASSMPFIWGKLLDLMRALDGWWMRRVRERNGLP